MSVRDRTARDGKTRAVARSAGRMVATVTVVAAAGVTTVPAPAAAGANLAATTATSAPLATAATRASAATAARNGTAVTGATLATTAAQGGKPRWTVRAPFYREFARRGDQDTSASNIEHVRELQYRLHFSGAYNGPVTGYFGELTQKAVKRYQRREELRVTGVANHKTWERVIKDSVRARPKIPRGCKRGDGWHACYDRKRHQVTLWRGGSLRNAWLVRGGSSDLKTRLGAFWVYKRDIDHVSGLYGSPMPYSQFFSGGQAFHGSSLMTDPFSGHSHGCVNMYIEDARQLWALTSAKRLRVHVYGAWS